MGKLHPALQPVKKQIPQDGFARRIRPSPQFNRTSASSRHLRTVDLYLDMHWIIAHIRVLIAF